MLSAHLGVERGTLSAERVAEIVEELARLPQMLGGLVARKEQYESLAERYSGYDDFLFLGRGVHYPLAMEGALKLKELSYIHAEGYQAGEMKHGPISLIDENMPVVALVPKYELYEKMLANVSEVKARGGAVIAIATEGDADVRRHRGRRPLHPGGVVVRSAHAGGCPDAASRVRDRRAARPRRRPAEEPGQVGHGRVAR